MKKVFEQVPSVDAMDNGRSLSLCLDDEDSDLFVRVHSWDETRKHEEFRRLIGKKIRVTIEIVE